MKRIRHIAALVTSLSIFLLLAAVGHPGAAQGSDSAHRPGHPDPTYTWSNRPSPVVLQLPTRNVALRTYMSCWTGPPDDDGMSSSTCADGPPPPLAKLPSIGKRQVVKIWFGMPGWQFEARLWRGTTCVAKFDVTSTGEQTFRVRLAAPRGTYRVEPSGTVRRAMSS